MLRLFGVALAGAVLIAATPSMAQTEKEQDCAYQSQVVEAVRQARIARVPERQVVDRIAADAPSWPERYNAAITLVTPWVYEMTMREVRTQDLASAWNEVCLTR